MQVEGYSLDAQKEKLKRYAEFQNMTIVGEYLDEGKSGKSVEGRPEFHRMLSDIESAKDSGKLMISVLSAVAEIERENILVQTMEGRRQKAREGKWNGGFATGFIKGVLDNPVYCGKLSYGRRKNEKVPGTRNEYRVVKQENYMLHDGVHEGIISEDDWNLAQRKRQDCI